MSYYKSAMTARLVLGALVCYLSYQETHGLITTLALGLILITLEAQTWINDRLIENEIARRKGE